MSRQAKESLRRRRRTEYKCEKFFGPDYYTTVRAHHEVGHAIGYLHLGLEIEKIVLVGSKPHFQGDPNWEGGTHEGLEHVDGFMRSVSDPTSSEDHWMTCIVGPVAEHAVWATWDASKYGTWQVTNGAEGDVIDMIAMLRNKKDDTEPSAEEKVLLIKDIAVSVARILRDDLNQVDDELRDVLGESLSPLLINAINGARDILTEHAAAHAAIIDALVNAVPDHAGDRVLTGAQVAAIWEREEKLSNQFFELTNSSTGLAPRNTCTTSPAPIGQRL